MKVLFCGLKFEYGKPEAGPSFEYQNLYEVLRQMEGLETEFFAIDEKISAVGRDALNTQLIETIHEKQPDLLFCFLFTEEIKKETIAYITNKTKTKTFNWFADDHWRFPIYSRYWAPLFTLVATTDSQTVQKYHRLGITNVIKTQWAANTFLYKPQDPAKNNDVYQITFVGRNYGGRGRYIQLLKANHLPAQGFGKDWPSGTVDFQTLLEIFSFSKINLNFTESPYTTWRDWGKLLAKFFFKKELGKFKFNVHNFFPNLESARGAQRRQIKSRTFEVPACGGFLLTADADNLRDYYEDGKEIIIFKDKNDLVEKCKFYLEHEEERKMIAQAGYKRTLKEHTYVHRFQEIFRALKLR